MSYAVGFMSGTYSDGVDVTLLYICLNVLGETGAKTSVILGNVIYPPHDYF